MNLDYTHNLVFVISLDSLAQAKSCAPFIMEKLYKRKSFLAVCHDALFYAGWRGGGLMQEVAYKTTGTYWGPTAHASPW